MEKCRYCLGEKFLKNGFVRGVQLHRCNHCGKNQIIGGKRGKYDNKTRGQALAMYLMPIHHQYSTLYSTGLMMRPLATRRQARVYEARLHTKSRSFDT